MDTDDFFKENNWTFKFKNSNRLVKYKKYNEWNLKYFNVEQYENETKHLRFFFRKKNNLIKFSQNFGLMGPIGFEPIFSYMTW